MENKYTYLFPFEKIPKNSKILIYGAGDVGQEYLQQILMTKYVEVLGFVDRSYEKYPQMVIPIYPPEYIKEASFDYVVLAFKTANVANDIRKIISKYVNEEKIVFQEPRNNVEENLLVDNSKSSFSGSFAFEKCELSIALKMGPQLGDAIIRKKVFLELVRMAPNALIDIYAPNADKFIYTIYNDQPELNEIINDGGTIYAINQKKYKLALTVFFMINIDYLDYENLCKLNFEFADKMRTHMLKHKEYGLSLYPSTQNRIHIGRSIYKGMNCYTSYNYTNVFNIEDSSVSIPLDLTYMELYKKLKLKKYITLNFGNGTTSKGNKHGLAKQWPWEYYNKLVKLFKKRYKDIEVIQVGDNTTECVEEVDRYLFGKDMELVKFVLKGAMIHIDIEGGLMHLASQLGTKCLVIFGPTQVCFFGYDNNINMTSENCGDCYCLYNDTLSCARGLDKPECMWTVTPEMVMKRIEIYFESLR